MKKLSTAILITAVCILFLASAAAAGGKLAVAIDDHSKKISLTIQDYGFTEDNKTYCVTVKGYNALKSGKSGSINDIMPFRIAIGFGLDDYLMCSSYGLTDDPVTIAYFENKDGTPLKEPKYIMIAQKDDKITNGYYYVIGEELFHDAYDIRILPEIPKATDPREEPEALKTAGNYITFGAYPQKEHGADKTPIEWLVLDYDEATHTSLLVSRYNLDSHAFRDTDGDNMWENSIVRTWLNGEFYQRVFSAEEQATIPDTPVDNGAAQGYAEWNPTDGTNTTDKVFLLSCAEAARYFGLSEWEDSEKPRSSRTDYTGINKRGSYQTAEKKVSSSWMLRSPGRDEDGIAVVGESGYLTSYRAIDCHDVRPAIRVDTEADFFLKPEKAQNPVTRRQALSTPGACINFGTYPQNRLGSDRTPIEWLVLDCDEAAGRALLVSRYLLDTKQYNEVKTDITWEDSSLRAWLNSDFPDAAFTDDEQKVILVTEVDNSGEQGVPDYKTDGGNNTQDRVFLLSYGEAGRFFSVDEQNRSLNMKAVAAPTARAVNLGAYADGQHETVGGESSGLWWLRSPSYTQENALYVQDDGNIGEYASAAARNICIRPAIWVDLNADIFAE